MTMPAKERRETITLSDEQMDDIAERAASHALNKVYEEVGRSIVKKFLWLVGAFALALLYVAAKYDLKSPFGG